METITIEKLVHGGQGIGTLADGRKVFVWGALPGERARVRLTRSKKSYAEAVAEEVIEASQDRAEPKEPYYLATSPWQILHMKAENQAKQAIVRETFEREHARVPEFSIVASQPEWGYRNKMEFAFWADETGLSLAHYGRGSRRKIPVQGSVLAMPAVNKAAEAVRLALQAAGAEGRQLKTVVVRADQTGRAAAALFVKDEQFVQKIPLVLPPELKGLNIYYSDPRSPASVLTKVLAELGDVHLCDTLLEKEYVYNVDSFFQVNVPIFTKALQRIKDAVLAADTIVDMYSGVGSIGLSVAAKSVKLVELDSVNVAMARLNAQQSGLAATVVEASTEKALEHITADAVVIFDPPRAGLHAKVIERLQAIKPQQIVYLSCNPATQARDIGLLQAEYAVNFFEAYNFFPHTPHIETLAILTR